MQCHRRCLRPLIERNVSVLWDRINTCKTCKMLNYRKKTTAASLAGHNLERPIKVHNLFCCVYIFHFSCRLKNKIQNVLWVWPPGSKKNWVLPLSNQGQKAFKNKKKHMTSEKTVNSRASMSSQSLRLLRFSPFPWFVSVGLRCVEVFHRHKRATVGRAGRLHTEVLWPNKTLMRFATNSLLNAARPWKDVE